MTRHSYASVRVADNPDAIQEASLQRVARYTLPGEEPVSQNGSFAPRAVIAWGSVYSS
jgi:hypothetical protein